MMYLENVDYFVRKIQFPNAASESLVVSNGDGTFDIYLNTLYPEAVLRERLAHEVSHLEHEHFYREDLTIRDVERQADGLASPRLPDVFSEAPAGQIPIFQSLDIFYRYMLAMRQQTHPRR